MKLISLTISDSEQWDQIVRSFNNYDVYYLSGYVKAFQIHGDGEPLLFYYTDGSLKAINVVMKRDISRDPHFSGCISENTYFDFATPYGYGGWLVEGDGDISGLFAAYERWCVRNQIISEFVRFHPMLDNQRWSQKSYEVIPLGNTVAMDLSSPEVIWTNIISKNRNVIRKAQKSGINIYRAQNPEIYQVFREIYNGTMDKDHAVDYYYFSPEFYSSVLKDLPRNAQVFYAVHPDGNIIAASIMLEANGKLNYHLSGSRREYQNLAPTNLLLYEAALWGYEHGCKSLHMGGGVGSGEDSLFKFKRAFYRGDDLKRFAIGKKIFIPESYEKLVALRDEIKNPEFFPMYRG